MWYIDKLVEMHIPVKLNHNRTGSVIAFIFSMVEMGDDRFSKQ
jgi:hypothetical protein